MIIYKILIVDDIIENLSLFTSIMENAKLNYKIYQAISGKSALELIKKRNPDLIITDWDMPEMSGIELIQEHKKNKETKEIPILLATGVMLSSNNLKIAFEAGAIDYIRKPFNKVELLARIKSVLELDFYKKQVIEEKNKELNENVLSLLRNNNFNINIVKKLKKLHEFVGFSENKINALFIKLIREIDTKIQNDTWVRFENSFDSVNSHFKKNLLTKHIDLTQSEFKLCALLKIGMSTKDISKILHQSEGAIKVSRSRIRKKLNIDKNMSIQMFLINV